MSNQIDPNYLQLLKRLDPVRGEYMPDHMLRALVKKLKAAGDLESIQKYSAELERRRVLWEASRGEEFPENEGEYIVRGQFYIIRLWSYPVEFQTKYYKPDPDNDFKKWDAASSVKVTSWREL